MKNLRKNDAITLVALVITIIILIILAGVSLNLALGQNGIFVKSKEAVDKYKDSAQREQSQLDKTYVSLEGKSLASQINADNYGDFVDYGIDLNGDGNTKNDWKIFYKGNSNGNKDRIFLIAADYVPTNNKELTEVMSSTKLNKSTGDNNASEYCVHWTSSDLPTYTCYDGHNETNKLNEDGTEHRQCAFPDIFESTKYYCSEHTDNTNSKCVSTLQCTEAWSPFATRDAEYAIGGPTLEMWINSWNDKHGNNASDTTQPLYCTGTNSLGYYVGTSNNTESTYVTGSSYYGNSKEGYNDTLYFPHQQYMVDFDNDGSIESCHAYWLASPSALFSNNAMSIRTDGNVDDGNCIADDNSYGDAKRRRASLSLSKV